MSTLTLSEFLLARIEEDEAKLRMLGDEPGRAWRHVTSEWLPPLDGDAAAVAGRFDPSRLLAECEAKRRIVEAAQEVYSEPNPPTTLVLADDALRALAAVYTDHPDFRGEWRP